MSCVTVGGATEYFDILSRYRKQERSDIMANTFILLIISLPFIGGIIYLFVLLCKALRKYIGSKELREEKSQIKKALGGVLKEHRVRHKMTQEFVAEYLGVSRQAVSK